MAIYLQIECNYMPIYHVVAYAPLGADYLRLTGRPVNDCHKVEKNLWGRMSDFRSQLSACNAAVGWRIFPALALVCLPAGCTRPSYMGISMLPGQAPLELQELAQRARIGDQQAQLDLGIRFEEGKGVSVDKKHATRLYRQAASNYGGTIWVYSPSPGNGAPARVIPMENGATQFGLEEARQRLSAIKQSEEWRR